MNRQVGFTLIEVLVALAIVAITLGAGIKAAGALTDNTQRLADVTSAEWCADNQLVNLRLTNLTPPIGDSEFACTELAVTYRGVVVVRPVANPLFRNIEVRISDEPGALILTVSTVMRR